MKIDLRRLLVFILAAVLSLSILVGCGQQEEPAEDNADGEKSDSEGFWDGEVEDFDFDEYRAECLPGSDYVPEEGLPIVKVSIKDGDDIILELYPETAPNTVNNFLALSRSGFYDGLVFHRIIVDFMIQGGDPLGTGTGNPGYSIDGEFAKNGFDNDLSHTPGVISMARSRDYNSAGSQFFIVHGDATFLDGDYAAFGNVIYGFEEVDRLANVKTGYGDKPEEDVVMESIRVDLNGYEFTNPTINN
ncbi:peptidyl-prolyl cis-trans isomerase B (cyclophilin B) [Dethiosulfatibacter aminovorans DSM 17477]|uniref:Peptidyl-prolyl cis-trans isomerase n=1 Tax=Dethiosulfatibacter aminovorans DSM 17477 TaxID=1121476 RepID=A0A1M6BU77_9FIRM|nr:peptidylprolyl isomerase [Dethiosulfatibacter aminovorans]SHI52315.1 peptidyl-prolyl cis-trans isomerase B (cyclophilin B) [Dethiosulfatibacter aminovorans DSM 17477]